MHRIFRVTVMVMGITMAVDAVANKKGGSYVLSFFKLL